MAFRNIIIESPARISLKGRQLVVLTDKEHTVAVEDISALLLESQQSTITTAALSYLGQSGCSVYLCDAKHMPCAIQLPFAGHCRELSVLRTQLDAGASVKKRLWQSIIISKIQNQAICLRMFGNKIVSDELFNLCDRVFSGDTGNIEALAAQKYFPALFYRGFSRADDNADNAALNYGYAILRGCIARHLAVSGFTPAIGLHHKSTLNSFNLADDLIEPFRPLVDAVVRSFPNDECDRLSPERKNQLFNCLNLDIESGGQHHSVNYAVERLVHSLSQSLENNEINLCLPKIIGLKQHRYE